MGLHEEYLAKPGPGLQPYPTGIWTLPALLTASLISLLVRQNGTLGRFSFFLPSN